MSGYDQERLDEALSLVDELKQEVKDLEAQLKVRELKGNPMVRFFLLDERVYLDAEHLMAAVEIVMDMSDHKRGVEALRNDVRNGIERTKAELS